MTKGEIAKRICSTVGVGLFLYVASVGPVKAYENRMRELSIYENTVFKEELISVFYSPIYLACEASPTVWKLFAAYIFWWEEIMQPKL